MKSGFFFFLNTLLISLSRTFHSLKKLGAFISKYSLQTTQELSLVLKKINRKTESTQHGDNMPVIPPPWEAEAGGSQT
jgi:hypothetical protein